VKITGFTIDGLPLIKKGDDLPSLICGAADLREGDILVLASTIVSKSQGRTRRLADITPTTRALEISQKTSNDPRFVQAVLEESQEVLLETPFLLVRSKTAGHICVNAGVDQSNIEEGILLLLPWEPDAFAAETRRSIKSLTGKNVGVLIIDTCGRPFRTGQTGIAIGASGLPLVRDWRGTRDLFGRTLEVKNEAIADEIAGFANLLLGEGNGATPAAIIRGYPQLPPGGNTIKTLNRPPREDVIRMILLRHREED